MTWRRDNRPDNVRTIGDISIFSEVNSDRETAHVVRFPDGREIRVLPDDTHNGRVRAAVVRGAVGELEQVYGLLGGEQGVLILLGALARAGLKWQELVGEVSIEEWLEEWFGGGPGAREEAERLLVDLKADGWEIKRRESDD